MEWQPILESLISTGVLVSAIEYFKYQRKNKADAVSVESENIEKAHRNSGVALETDMKILTMMKEKVDELIKELDDAQKERKELKIQLENSQTEIKQLHEKVDKLIRENIKLTEELSSFEKKFVKKTRTSKSKENNDT